MPKIIIDIPEEDYILATKEDFSAIYNGNHIAKAIKNGTPLDDIKSEISSKLITHGQVIEGEYFAEDAEYINHGLNMALEIINKYIGERSE